MGFGSAAAFYVVFVREGDSRPGDDAGRVECADAQRGTDPRAVAHARVVGLEKCHRSQLEVVVPSHVAYASDDGGGGEVVDDQARGFVTRSNQGSSTKFAASEQGPLTTEAIGRQHSAEAAGAQGPTPGGLSQNRDTAAFDVECETI